MIWKSITLYKNVDGEEDELGNAVLEQMEIWNGQGKFTPWSTAEIAVNDRAVTETEQRYIVPAPYSTAKDAELFEVDGYVFNITSITDLSPRWVILQGKRYK